MDVSLSMVIVIFMVLKIPYPQIIFTSKTISGQSQPCAIFLTPWVMFFNVYVQDDEFITFLENWKIQAKYVCLYMEYNIIGK